MTMQQCTAMKNYPEDRFSRNEAQIIVCQSHKRRRYITKNARFKEKHCNVITLFAETLHCLQVSMPRVFLVLRLGQEIMCDQIRN